jgi:hypothetical protein
MGRIFCTLLIVTVITSVADAQLLNKRGEEVHPYYISFDAPVSANVENVRGEFLNISYRDRVGKSETIKFAVYNSVRQLVRELTLVKQFGQNYFDIKLQGHNIVLIENETYFCRLTNEKSETQERMIKYLPKVKNEISATIVVVPKQLACENNAGASNLVEFYGQISGGMAPYKANWYVLNARRSDFLYEPSYAVVPEPGLTSSVQVDKSPEYYVLLHVTDACGNERTATVQILCQRNEKKVNTLFFEKLDDAIIKKVENFK